MRRVTWAQAVDAFVDRMRSDNCSPATIETYRCLLVGGPARRFCAEHGVERPDHLTVEVFEAMKREFLGRALRPATVDDYCRVWRTFARFCFERGFRDDDAVLHVRGPRLPKNAPRTFTAAEEQTILAACRCERDRVLVQLVLETGLRRTEVAHLDVDDIERSPQGWLLRIRQGKGRKDRGVPLSPDLSNVLARYLAKVRPASECHALFLTNARVCDGDYGGLTSNGIYQIWRRLSQATGIRAYPHKGRHTAATRWAEDGVSPWAIKQALGHTTLAMTNRYVDSSAVNLRAEFNGRRQQELRGADRIAILAEVRRALSRAGIDAEDVLATVPAKRGRR